MVTQNCSIFFGASNVSVLVVSFVESSCVLYFTETRHPECEIINIHFVLFLDVKIRIVVFSSTNNTWGPVTESFGVSRQFFFGHPCLSYKHLLDNTINRIFPCAKLTFLGWSSSLAAVSLPQSVRFPSIGDFALLSRNIQQQRTYHLKMVTWFS